MNKIISLHDSIKNILDLTNIRLNMEKIFKGSFISEDLLEKQKISSGSFGTIFLIEKNSKNYIKKKPIAHNKDDLKAAKTDAIISALLSSVQELYLENKAIICPKIYAINKEQENSQKIYSIYMEKYEGDIFNMFCAINLNDIDKIKLVIQMLLQISNILLLLQDSFKFMHNDLKANNILYYRPDKTKPITSNNITFIISDFGGSNIEINNKKIEGFIMGNQYNFDKGKDIFLLIHIIITFQISKYKKMVTNFFETIFDSIDLKYCKKNDDIWHQLYQMDNYPDEFHPSNVLNKINKLQLE